MARKPVYSAGGVVVRDGGRPRIAIVQRSKDDRWVLPRGKLKRGEPPLSGARREVTEETGHRVRAHEYLGAITYRASGRPKVVQFWSMEAAEHPSFDLMKDISAVAWLPLPAAILKLSYPLEKLFLRHVGRQALLQRRARSASTARKRSPKGGKGKRVGKAKANPRDRKLKGAASKTAKPRSKRRLPAKRRRPKR